MPLLKTVASATITLYKINDIALYNAEIISTNGNIFHPYDIETTLILKVYKNIDDITNKFTDIVWSKHSINSNEIIEDSSWGEKYINQTMIQINKDDFNQKCVIQADVYEFVNKKRTCVASARITLMDVNELYSSNVPPENPIDGLLWVDTSGNAPIIYSWNDVSKKWTRVGETTPSVRNLILNSNFWRLNSTDFKLENESCLYNLIVENKHDKTWLRLKNHKKVDVDLYTTAGIYQTTSYPIVTNSYYTLSLKAFRNNDMEYMGDSSITDIRFSR